MIEEFQVPCGEKLILSTIDRLKIEQAKSANKVNKTS